ncbi:MAG: S8 family serine peptidase [Chloroherpetonaceae bacterium]|nr:S8 family serine peptidase [Chloroherpetonaceae bacterium]
MRKYFLIASLLLVIASNAIAQESRETYYNGSRVESLTPVYSQVFVKFRSTVSKAKAKSVVNASVSLMPLDESKIGAGNKVILSVKSDYRIGQKASQALQGIRQNPDVEAAYFAYTDKTGDVYYVTNEVIVAPLKGASTQFASVLSAGGYEVMERIGSGTDFETFIIRTSENPFKVSKALYESGYAKYAHPNFTQMATVASFQEKPSQEDPKKGKKVKKDTESASVIDEPLLRSPKGKGKVRVKSAATSVEKKDAEVFQTVEDLQRGEFPAVRPEQAKKVGSRNKELPSIFSTFTPNDPNYTSQWWLNNTGQFGGIPGSDVDAPEAWFLAQGDTNIVVSVWDAGGYDYTHYELEGKVINPYDAARDDNDPAPQNSNSNHGTPCTGIIAALTNNGRGVSSIGNGIKVMPVDIATVAPDANGSFGTDDATLTRAAARVVATPGVAAVSNSWGGGGVTAGRLAAVENVRLNARGGKGALVLASTGNGGTSTVNGYPANAPFVIGVGAITYRDRRASFSQWGDSLDVVAPGDFSGPSSGILTIDRRGADGYDAGDTTNFGGTSAACPVAAGLVGLIASADTNLTAAQLSQILESTSEKVAGYSFVNYPGRPNGTWNNELGYGRVNARRAIEAAQGKSGFSFLSPLPGTVWKTGASETVRWATSGTVSGNVKLLLKKAGTVVDTISLSSDNNGTATYTVKSDLALGADYTVQISNQSGTVSATSAPFGVSNSKAFRETYPLSFVNSTIGTYTDLGANGNAITPANNDDSNSDPVPIGFDFNYAGNVFSSFVLNTNGFVKLGSSPTSKPDLFPAGIRDQTTVGSALWSTDTADVNILSPFNVDLIGTDSVEYRVFTSGSAPNRVTTVQFKNVREKKDTSATLGVRQYTAMNFQVKLYETTNNVEFSYGAFTPNTNPGEFRTAVVGMKSVSPAEGVSVFKGSGTAWNAAGILTEGSDRANYRNNVNIANGQRYLFVNSQNAPTPVKLVVQTIPSRPIINQPFSAVVQVQSADGTPTNVTGETTVQVSVTNGTGNFTGTASVTFYPWDNTKTITGLRYDKAETGLNFNATVASGPSLTAASIPLTVRATPARLNFNQNLVSNTQGTYTELGSADGTVIATANTDDANSAPISIGFPFVFRGSTFNEFVFNTNGFIKLGSDAPSKANLFIETPQDQTGLNGAIASIAEADSNIISVLNHDLQAGTLGAEYRVHTTGTEPNRVTTIQWKNVRDKNRTGITTPGLQFNNVNFQLKLYETSNDVEFVYGTFTGSTSTGAFRTFGVGLKGADTVGTQVIILQKGSGTAWASALIQRFAAGTLNMSRTATAGLPTSGRTIRFVSEKPPTFVQVVPIGGTVSAGQEFTLTARTFDNANFRQGVTTETQLSVSVASGSATLGGTTTVTLQPGQSEAIFTGLTLNTSSSDSVSLQVSASSGMTLTAGTSNRFLVSVSLPNGVSENFTATTFPPTGWQVANPDAGSITWGRSTAGFPTGGSAFMNHWDYEEVGERDTLKTPLFLVSNNVGLGFEVAYSTFTDAPDTLEVWASLDSGKTYSTRLFKKGGVELSTAPSVFAAFVPTASQWRTERVDLRAYAGTGIRLAFVTNNQYGNNMYVDSIRTETLVTPSKLVVTAQPTGTRLVNTPFSITLQTQDSANVVRPVLDSVTVTVSLSNGTGVLGGTLTRVIPKSASSVTFSDLTYNNVEQGVTLSFAANSGAGLSSVTTTALNFGSPLSANYRRVTTRGVYSSLNNPIGSGITDPDDGSVSLTIPFSANFNGKAYTTVNAGSNGVLSFEGSAASATNSALFTTAAPVAALAPWWDDLILIGADSLRSSVRGTEPNRVFTVEYANVRDYWSNTGATGATLNYQVRIYEGSNLVEFVYGPKNGTTFATLSSASIGMKGSVGGSGDFIDATTGSTTVGVSTLTSSAQFPQSGVVYRFVPTSGVRATDSAVAVMAAGTASMTSFGSTGVSCLADVSASSETAKAAFFNHFPLFSALPSGVTGILEFHYVLSNGGTFTNGVLKGAVSKFATSLASNRLVWLYRADSSAAWASLGGTVVNDSLVTTAPLTAFGEFAIGYTEPVASIAEEKKARPTNFELGQNYPNPFNPSTSIKYALPQSSTVLLKVYDMLGREVSTLVDGRKEAGSYTAVFNAQNLSSGVYFYRLQAGSFNQTRKMILIK